LTTFDMAHTIEHNNLKRLTYFLVLPLLKHLTMNYLFQIEFHFFLKHKN